MPESWPEALRAQCAAAIDELASYALTRGGGSGSECEGKPEPEPEPETDVTGPPSLYSFYEELLTMRNEMRRGNRKVAETFGRFSDVLEGMRQESGRLRERLAASSAGAEINGSCVISRGLALALVDICDRVDRLEAAARSQAQKGWLTRIKAEGSWRKQAEAISFLRGHLQPVLASAGIHRIAVLGQPFDPLWMRVLSYPDGSSSARPEEANPAGGAGALVVAEELLPGYRMGDQCLRPAEVRLASSV